MRRKARRTPIILSWTLITAAWLGLGVRGDLLAETFDLHVRGYCPAASSFCGHGSYGAYRKHVLEAVQEMNTEWEVVGISFRPWVPFPLAGTPYEQVRGCTPDDPNDAIPEDQLRQQWQAEVASQSPKAVTIMVTWGPNMCCSAVPPGAPPEDWFGIFCDTNRINPRETGSIWAHEMGHHFCLPHTWAADQTGTPQDTANDNSGDPVDWDLDVDVGITDTPPDPERFEPYESGVIGKDEDASHNPIPLHEWCTETVNETPFAVDAGSPHPTRCGIRCFQRLGSTTNSQFMPGGQLPFPQAAMSYYDYRCRGPYVLGGDTFEAFSHDTIGVVLFCRFGIRPELPDVCAGKGGDTDHDGWCNAEDNCAAHKNTAQADTDQDGFGDVCDFSLMDPSPSTDIDGDLVGSILDQDNDGDGCPDISDQHPDKGQVITGTKLASPCGFGAEPVYTFEGQDSDSDGLIDCKDLDDDNDGVCDEGGPLPSGTPGAPAGCSPGGSGQDICPLQAGILCHVQGSGPPCPPDYLLCFGTGCKDFYLKISPVQQPAAGLVLENFQIFNKTLYVQPPPGRSASQLAKALQGVFEPLGLASKPSDPPAAALDSGGSQGVVTGPFRLEVWRRGATRTGDRLVAVVMDYESDQVLMGDITRGGFLGITPGVTMGGDPVLYAGSTYARGLMPGEPPPVDGDGDGWPDPLDNCPQAPNALQTDADRDGFGNACDADLDGDRVVTQVDVSTVQGCERADLTLTVPISEPPGGEIHGLAQFPPNPVDIELSSRCGAADLDGSLLVDSADAQIASQSIGTAPGPSAFQPQTSACPGPAACDDSDPCTSDLCDPGSGRCLNLRNTCDDSDPCTQDLCDPMMGGCTHQPVVCSDGSRCTIDACNPITGECEQTPGPDGVPCDDGDLCTTSDTCLMGACAGQATSCDDRDPCTPDVCEPGTGRCVSGPPTCDDANPCTADSCGGGGCVNAALPDGTTCSDGSACTLNDSCQAGQCAASSSVNCDDGNLCTADTCNPAGGQCGHEPLACDDGSVLTTDSCDQGTGQCLFAPIPPLPPATVVFTSQIAISWQPSPLASHWNSYRGTIPPELMGSRRSAYDHLCFESGDLGGDGPTSTMDFTDPPQGSAFYYLVSGENHLIEGPLGDGPFMNPPSPCRTPP